MLGLGAVLRPTPLCPQSRDAGTYTCIAENAVGRAHRHVHLTILALPVFVTLPGDRSLRLGDRLWLHCVARGSPTPRLGWTVNDQPVTGLGLLGTLGGRGGWAGGPPPPNLVERKWVLVVALGLGLQTWTCAGDGANPHVAIM